MVAGDRLRSPRTLATPDLRPGNLRTRRRSCLGKYPGCALSLTAVSVRRGHDCLRVGARRAHARDISILADDRPDRGRSVLLAVFDTARLAHGRMAARLGR